MIFFSKSRSEKSGLCSKYSTMINFGNSFTNNTQLGRTYRWWPWCCWCPWFCCCCCIKCWSLSAVNVSLGPPLFMGIVLAACKRWSKSSGLAFPLKDGYRCDWGGGRGSDWLDWSKILTAAETIDAVVASGVGPCGMFIDGWCKLWYWESCWFDWCCIIDLICCSCCCCFCLCSSRSSHSAIDMLLALLLLLTFVTTVNKLASTGRFFNGTLLG